MQQNARIHAVMAPFHCVRRGYQQRNGTCWFNAILNGFIMAEWSGALLLRMLQNLSVEEVQQMSRVIAEGVRRCPDLPNRAHILAHASVYWTENQRHVPRRGPLPAPTRLYRQSVTDEGRFYGSRAVNLIYQLYEPHVTRRAFDVVRGGIITMGLQVPDAGLLRPIVDQLFAPTEYHMVEAVMPSEMERVAERHPDKKLLIFERRSPREREFARGDPGFTFPRTLGTYRLNHALLALYMPDNAGGHAVAAFRCRGSDYIYDAAPRGMAHKCRWSNGILTDISNRYKDMYASASIPYVCYVNAGVAVLPDPVAVAAPAPAAPAAPSRGQRKRTRSEARAGTRGR